MKKTFSQKKSAFSLIELSIVLIIIGLLIAGVTGGASLIKSSELRSVMGEARAYATAVNGFYTQFNYLPGDYGVVVGASAVGDADGKIEDYLSASISESHNAWMQMKAAAVLDGNSVSAPAYAPAAESSGVTVPASKVKAAVWDFDYRSNEAAPFTNEISQNVVALISSTATIPTASGVTIVNGANKAALAVLMATDALSIDAKIDDSVAGTGKVRGLNIGISTTPSSLSANTNDVTICYYSTSFTYNTSDTVKSCGLTYQVDVNS